ncbi:MAG: RNA polymerase sigma factor [Longibaculum sp.]
MDNKEIDQIILDIPHNEFAFHELYVKTKTIVFAYIMSIVKNYDDSSDVLQETYIKIYLASHHYESMKKPLAWIYTIARNESYLYLRRKKLNQEYDDNCAFPQDMDIKNKLYLEQLFEVLNEKERQIIIMHSLWGFKHYEIANLLDIPLATSLSSYRRGMKKMKEIGGQVYEETL